jgi:hypothetical protein
LWVSAIAGFSFLVVHAIYVRYFAKPEEFSNPTPPAVAARIPEKIARHSLAARLFHWIMAASMFTLLLTAFLPKIGVQFAWVTYHWMAGVVLTISILFHIIHASFWLDFWSIWPDKADLEDAVRRIRRFIGRPAPPPRRFAKYPPENKLYHGAIIAAGLSAIRFSSPATSVRRFLRATCARNRAASSVGLTVLSIDEERWSSLTTV